MSNANERLVTDFIMSWMQGMDAFDRCLAEDLIYHNMPLQPIHGRQAAREFLEPFIAPKDPPILEAMEIPHTASVGGVVMNERVETWVKGDVRVVLPVAGVFEVRDGRITHWRDYFDLSEMKALFEAVLSA